MNFAPFCSWDSMSPSTCCEFLISSRAEIKYHARLDELERVDETAVDLSELILVARIIILKLAITGTSIKARAFGKRIVVASGNAVVLGVFISLINSFFRQVHIVKTSCQRTTSERSSSTQVQTVALQTQLTQTEFCGCIITCINSRLMLEVLRFGKELNNFKVVVAANEDQLPILIKSTCAIGVSTILRQFVTDSKRGGTIFTGQANRGITLSVRGTLIAVVLWLAVGTNCIAPSLVSVLNEY